MRSAGKLLMTVFWDHRGVLLTDFLSRGRTMNGAYYGDLIEQLRQSVKEKRRGLLTKRVFLLHDNAPVHKFLVAQQKIRDSGFTELNHPPYSPDIAPCDFFCFPP